MQSLRARISPTPLVLVEAPGRMGRSPPGGAFTRSKASLNTNQPRTDVDRLSQWQIDVVKPDLLLREPVVPAAVVVTRWAPRSIRAERGHQQALNCPVKRTAVRQRDRGRRRVGAGPDARPAVA